MKENTRVTSEVLLLREVWRKALREGSIPLVLGTEKQATRVRMQLYNALAGCRKGTVDDPELLEAWETCEVVRESSRKLVVRRKLLDDALQRVAQQAGIEMDALLPEAPAPALSARLAALLSPAASDEHKTASTLDERELRELMGKVELEAPAPSVPVKANPYYAR